MSTNSLWFQLGSWARFLTPLNAYIAPFHETPKLVAARMLSLAGVSTQDTVYDLGCGNGSFLLAAAARGATAVGYELNVDLAEQAKRRVTSQGLESTVAIRRADARQADVERATVIAMYLSERGNSALVRALWSKLLPQTRVVTFTFPIHGLKTARTDTVDGISLYLYKGLGAGGVNSFGLLFLVKIL